MDLSRTGYALARAGDLLDALQDGRIFMGSARGWSARQTASFIEDICRSHPMPPVILWQLEDGKCMVIDGRRRLNALLGALRGRKVEDEKGLRRPVRVACNPFTGAFAARSKSIAVDPDWIASISRLILAARLGGASGFAKDFIAHRRAARKDSSAWDEDAVDSAVSRILALEDREIPLCVLSRGMEIGEILRIFRLANAIPPDSRDFSREEVIACDLLCALDPQSKRVAEYFEHDAHGAGGFPVLQASLERCFSQAAMVAFGTIGSCAAFAACQGSAVEFGHSELSFLGRSEHEFNSSLLRDALNVVADPQVWADFTALFAQSGFINASMLPSKEAVDAMYAAYACGRRRAGVHRMALDPLMRRWIFMAAATGRYCTGDKEFWKGVGYALAELGLQTDPHSFLKVLRERLDLLSGADFFKKELPARIATATEGSSLWIAFNAALNVLGSRLLFSDMLQREAPFSGDTVVPPSASGAPLPPERLTRHHIFPQAYLRDLSPKAYKARNLIANLTMLDSAANGAIGDASPADYSYDYMEKLGKDAFRQSCLDNAIPPSFGLMNYMQFITERGALMAKAIEQAYAKISMGMQAPMSAKFSEEEDKGELAFADGLLDQA